MEFCHSYLFVTFVVMTLHQIVGRDDGHRTCHRAKTRFCSHINFIGRCLNSKVIPKGFARTFMRLHSLTQISIFTKFDVRKILFHVIL